MAFEPTKEQIWRGMREALRLQMADEKKEREIFESDDPLHVDLSYGEDYIDAITEEEVDAEFATVDKEDMAGGIIMTRRVLIAAMTEPTQGASE